MFWRSIPSGFELLANPRVWLLIILLILIHLGYWVGLRLATQPKESQSAAAPGCLTLTIGILLQGFLMGVFVLFLLPILLGFSDRLVWTEVESFTLLAARAGIFAVLLLSAVSFIPYFGRFLAASPGLEAFLAGTLIFRLTSPLFVEKTALGRLGKTPAYPTLWESLGYLALAVLFTQAFMILSHLAAQGVRNSKFSEITEKVLGPSLDILGGIFALLMYASFVRLSLD